MSERRTLQQNKALHLWFEMVSDTLNAHGLTVMKVLRHDADIPWNEYRVKELLWRPVQEAMTGHESTTECDKPDYSAIEEVVSKHLAESLGVVLPPFPSEWGKAHGD